MTLIALVLGFATYCKIAEVFFNLLTYHERGVRYYVSPDWFGSGHAVVPLVPMIQRVDTLAKWGLVHVLVCGVWLLVLLITDVWKFARRHAACSSLRGKGSMEL